MVATRLLEGLLPLFDSHRIKAILLKGAAFWTSIYSPTERVVSDIDVLISPSDKSLSEKCILGLGFERVLIPGRPATERELYESCYVDSKGSFLPLELHTSLAHPVRYHFDTGRLFERAEPCQLGTARAWRLCPEDSLLHLAIHRTIHNFGFNDDLRNIEDAHRIIDKRCINWSDLLGRAQQWGCKNALWVLLDSAVRKHGAGVPARVLADLEMDSTRRRLFSRVMKLEQGAWVFRWQKMTSWKRRLLLFPIVLDRPPQHCASAFCFAGVRMRDWWESTARR
ncbi:MAG: hypothetical protein A2341_09440 [Deltaproteobacteria bacterium RIFOXYB12_FULL_58_9]|nr:MAG: hypothetical protein A2341_09440 [Deltaproteobacteria bacterium RIFOXYB12_FULL_58_9]